MKKILSITITALFLLSLSASANIRPPVAQGNTNGPLGAFTINKAGSLEMIKGKPLRTYEISYENSPYTLMVAVDDSNEDFVRYLVISEGLVVEYDCRLNYFGARIIDDRFQKEGFCTNRQNLDTEQYYRQKLITGEELNETEYLRLISVYFPKLVKYRDRIYAVKD